MRGRRWLCGAVLLAVIAGCTSAPTALPPVTTSTVAVSPVDVSPAPVSPVAVSPLAVSPISTSPSPAGTTPTSTAMSNPSTSRSEPAAPVSPVPTATAGAVSTVSTSAGNATRVPVATLPGVDLAGVNVAGCRSARRPVVLLHGSFSTVGSNFSALVPVLLAGGRCVYGVNYGNAGIAAVTSSARQAAALVRAVLDNTGAATVDVIAYSQGGLVLRTALRFDGLADEVATAVLVAPSWHGTTSAAAASAPASLCPACADQVAGSALLQRLSAGGELDGTVRYAELSTRRDTVVLPVASQIPAGPPDRVRSVVLEDICPQVVTDHVHLPAVPGVVAWSVAALDSDGRPAPSALTC